MYRPPTAAAKSRASTSASVSASAIVAALNTVTRSSNVDQRPPGNLNTHRTENQLPGSQKPHFEIQDCSCVLIVNAAYDLSSSAGMSFAVSAKANCKSAMMSPTISSRFWDANTLPRPESQKRSRLQS